MAGRVILVTVYMLSIGCGIAARATAAASPAAIASRYGSLDQTTVFPPRLGKFGAAKERNVWRQPHSSSERAAAVRTEGEDNACTSRARIMLLMRVKC